MKNVIDMKKKFGLVLLLWMGTLLGVQAQTSGITNYFMQPSVTRSVNNPAFIAPYGGYFGVPAVSGLHVQLSNEMFSWSRLVKRGEDDSLRITIPNLLSYAVKRNRIGIEADVPILAGGFSVDENHFTIGLAARVEASPILTRNTLNLLLNGPGAHLGNNDLSGNSINASAYAYLYLGYARKVSDMVTIGAKFKLIDGLYNLTTTQNSLQWNILNNDMEDPEMAPYTYALQTDAQFRTNLDLDDSLSLNSYMPTYTNFGFGVDVGVSVDFAPNWNFSASILDMGAIFWRGRTSEWNSRNKNEVFYFQGFENIDLFEDELNLDTMLYDLKNLALEKLGFEKKSTKGYTTALSPTIMLSFDYTLLEQHRFGLVYKGRLLTRDYFYSELGIAYTFTLNKNFSISVNNVFTSRSALNFGLAFVGNLGPLQLHLGVDRINSFNVKNMRGVNINFGLNFVLNKREIFTSVIEWERSQKAPIEY